RQVVFRYDHARGLGFRPRQGLQRILPLIGRAQIRRGQPFGHWLKRLCCCFADWPASASGQQLRTSRTASLSVKSHALNERHELVGGVSGSRNAFEAVAAGALEQKLL